MKAIQVSEYHVCFLALRDKGKGSVLLNQQCIYMIYLIFMRENKFTYMFALIVRSDKMNDLSYSGMTNDILKTYKIAQRWWPSLIIPGPHQKTLGNPGLISGIVSEHC